MAPHARRAESPPADRVVNPNSSTPRVGASSRPPRLLPSSAVEREHSTSRTGDRRTGEPRTYSLREEGESLGRIAKPPSVGEDADAGRLRKSGSTGAGNRGRGRAVLARTKLGLRIEEGPESQRWTPGHLLNHNPKSHSIQTTVSCLGDIRVPVAGSRPREGALDGHGTAVVDQQPQVSVPATR